MVPAPPPDRPGVILVAHGSARSGASAEPVLALAAQLRRRGFPEVHAAFWKEEPFLHQALDAARASVLRVLPVFLAQGYFAREVVPRELGLRYGWNQVGGRTVQLLPPLGTHPALDELVAARAREAAPAGARVADTLLVVMGHGTERDRGSAGTVLDAAARLAERGEFGRVVPAFIDQAPRVEDVLDAARERVVLLVPFLVAAGWHGGTTVPSELGLNGGDAAVGGRTVIYTEPVGTHAGLVDVVEATLSADPTPTFAHGGAAWPASDALESALRARLDGPSPLRLLEVAIATTDDGWELRHALDAEIPAGSLTQLADRDALERRARTTEDGRHRPLRTAASLARGWRHRARTVPDLIDALVALYGPALAHWWMGDRGALSTVGFREAAARQSGIYARLARVEPATIDAGVRGVCDGLPCLRRRTWTPEGAVVGPPRAQGAELIVPCPAPCPVLLTSVLELAGGDERDDPESA